MANKNQKKARKQHQREQKQTGPNKAVFPKHQFNKS